MPASCDVWPGVVGLELWRYPAELADSILRSAISTQMLARADSGSSTPTTVERRLPQVTGPRNPISLRLYKVLAANFEDAATREALRTLSDFYATPTDSAGKGKQPQAAGASADEAERTVNGHTLSTPLASTSAALRARKNLRRDIELRLADGSQQFLQAFGAVDAKLDVLKSHVDAMRARCDEMQAQLQASNAACRYLLERADGLQAQRSALATRQALASAFLARFTLTEDERDAITSRDVPVGSRMFDAMDRAQRIREECHVLLSGDGGASQAGMDIMAMTAGVLEQGFQKLARWCAASFRLLGSDAQLDVSAALREAVRRLRAQPALLADALGVLAVTRSAAVAGAFVAALTRGGPGGRPRPIELHAHDPPRYVGDMLAWVHQACAGEHEFLEALFGVPQRRMVGSVRDLAALADAGAALEEEREWVRRLMDENLEKLCLPLRVRVQQTARSQEGSITAYKIANLLQFYLVTMQRTVGSAALLSRTLQECVAQRIARPDADRPARITDFAYKVFFETVEAQGRALLRFLHPPEADLGAPLALRDFAQVLREILGVHASSLLDMDLVADAGAAADATPDAKRILAAALGPALEMCRRMAEMRADARQWEQAVFLVNSYAYLQAMLQPFEFAAERVEELESMIQEQVVILLEEHSARMLADSGLGGFVAAIDSTPADVCYSHEFTRDPDATLQTPLAHVPSAAPAALSTALRDFDAFLSALDVHSAPRLALLAAAEPRRAGAVHGTALARLARSYGRVCAAVREPRNRYEFAGTLLGSRRPFGNSEVLAQVLGIPEEEA